MDSIICGFCQREAKDPIGLLCSHYLCLHCAQFLQVVDSQSLIQNRYSLSCPNCRKITMTYNINNLLIYPWNSEYLNSIKLLSNSDSNNETLETHNNEIILKNPQQQNLLQVKIKQVSPHGSPGEQPSLNQQENFSSTMSNLYQFQQQNFFFSSAKKDDSTSRKRGEEVSGSRSPNQHDLNNSNQKLNSSHLANNSNQKNNHSTPSGISIHTPEKSKQDFYPKSQNQNFNNSVQNIPQPLSCSNTPKQPYTDSVSLLQICTNQRYNKNNNNNCCGQNSSNTLIVNNNNSNNYGVNNSNYQTIQPSSNNSNLDNSTVMKNQRSISSSSYKSQSSSIIPTPNMVPPIAMHVANINLNEEQKCKIHNNSIVHIQSSSRNSNSSSNFIVASKENQLTPRQQNQYDRDNSFTSNTSQYNHKHTLQNLINSSQNQNEVFQTQKSVSKSQNNKETCSGGTLCNAPICDSNRYGDFISQNDEIQNKFGSQPKNHFSCGSSMSACPSPVTQNQQVQVQQSVMVNNMQFQTPSSSSSSIRGIAPSLAPPSLYGAACTSSSSAASVGGTACFTSNNNLGSSLIKSSRDLHQNLQNLAIGTSKENMLDVSQASPAIKPISNSQSRLHSKSVVDTEFDILGTSSNDISCTRSNNPSLMCTIHNQPLTLYCNNDQMIVCVECIYSSKSHKNHVVIPLKSATKLIQQQNDGFRLETSNKFSSIENAINTCSSNKIFLEASYLNINSIIEKQFQEIYEMVRQKQTELQNEIECFYQGKIEEYMNKINELGNLKNVIKEFTDVEKIINNEQLNECQKEVCVFNSYASIKETIQNIDLDFQQLNFDQMITIQCAKQSTLQNLLDQIIAIDFSQCDSLINQTIKGGNSINSGLNVNNSSNQQKTVVANGNSKKANTGNQNRYGGGTSINSSRFSPNQISKVLGANPNNSNNYNPFLSANRQLSSHENTYFSGNCKNSSRNNQKQIREIKYLKNFINQNQDQQRKPLSEQKCELNL